MKRVTFTAALAVLTFATTQAFAGYYDGLPELPKPNPGGPNTKILLAGGMPDADRTVTPGGPDSLDGPGGAFLNMKFVLPKTGNENEGDGGVANSDTRVIQVAVANVNGNENAIIDPAPTAALPGGIGDDDNTIIDPPPIAALPGTGDDNMIIDPPPIAALPGSGNDNTIIDPPQEVQVALKVLVNNQVAAADPYELDSMHGGGYLPRNIVLAASTNPNGEVEPFLPYNKPTTSEVQTAAAVVQNYVVAVAGGSEEIINYPGEGLPPQVAAAQNPNPYDYPGEGLPPKGKEAL